MVTEEKVFLPTAEELRAAEIEQALEVGSITFFHLFCIFIYDVLYIIMIVRWKVRLDPLPVHTPLLSLYLSSQKVGNFNVHLKMVHGENENLASNDGK